MKSKKILFPKLFTWFRTKRLNRGFKRTYKFMVEMNSLMIEAGIPRAERKAHWRALLKAAAMAGKEL